MASSTVVLSTEYSGTQDARAVLMVLGSKRVVLETEHSGACLLGTEHRVLDLLELML